MSETVLAVIRRVILEQAAGGGWSNYKVGLVRGG
jgi:hypothetical protein